MSNVIAFPSPMSDRRTAIAVEVIVAPAADLWIAWLRLPCGRFRALERTPERLHALSDARAYAGRHGVPVTVLRDPLPVVLDQTPRWRGGEISIWLDARNSNRWCVDHTSASGDSVSLVGTAFSLEEAVAIASEAARQTGAIFIEPGLGGVA